jgi:hypothetical protein
MTIDGRKRIESFVGDEVPGFGLSKLVFMKVKLAPHFPHETS